MDLFKFATETRNGKLQFLHRATVFINPCIPSSIKGNLKSKSFHGHLMPQPRPMFMTLMVSFDSS